MSIDSSEPGFNRTAPCVPQLSERKGPMRADDRRQRHFDELSRGRAAREIRALQVEGKRLFEGVS